MVDDATNEVPYAKFFPQDTLFGNMDVIRRFIQLKGVFMSLYVDKASHFKTTRHGGQIIQIPPSDIRLSFARTKVDVCLLEDKRIFVLHKGPLIAES